MSWTVVPEGKKAGCLPRRWKAGTVCAVADDIMQIIPRSEWRPLIDERKRFGVSVRQLVDIVFDQDGVGSCASEAATQTLQLTRKKQGKGFVQLNPWFVYHTVSGGRDQGSSIDENMRFLMERGIASEAVWPRSKGWQAVPSEAAYQDAATRTLKEFWSCETVDQIGTCLLEGHIVQFGWKSHSECLLELIDENTALCVNSWGLYSGSDQGYHPVPLSAIDFRYGAYAGRAAE
jgi:hypothetical protein